MTEGIDVCMQLARDLDKKTDKPNNTFKQQIKDLTDRNGNLRKLNLTLARVKWSLMRQLETNQSRIKELLENSMADEDAAAIVQDILNDAISNVFESKMSDETDGAELLTSLSEAEESFLAGGANTFAAWL